MPSRNTIKTYVKDGIYHIYNRGVEKRNIFLDEQDYKIFLYYLKSYLLPLEQQDKSKLPSSLKRINSFNLFEEIKLIAYCLMPNHFHLLVKQLSERAIVEFMKRMSNAYVEYFNKKYDRQGSLFQGRYKASLVVEDVYFMYLSSYIHRNTLELFAKLSPREKIKKMEEYSYSSYPDYLGKRNTPWVCRDEILSLFEHGSDRIISKFSSYKQFVEELETADLLDGDMALDRGATPTEIV